MVARILSLCVVTDLRVYMQHSGGRLSHCRDNDDLEVDVISETEDESWDAIELELGKTQVDDGAKTLLKFARK